MPTSERKKKTGAMVHTSDPSEEAMCEWVDRHTVRYVRELSHSVERVWRAVTEADEIARWFIGPVEIDLRVGGAYSFGRRSSAGFSGTIQRLDPPRLVEFESWRFELEPIEDGCRLTFTDWVGPGSVMGGEPGDPDGRDQPFGPGTHWPGVLVGWHGFLDQLRRALDDPDGYYGWPLSESDQAAHDGRAKQGDTAAFIAAYREHMERSPVLIASGRQEQTEEGFQQQRSILYNAVIGHSDEEIAAFAATVGGYAPLLGLVFSSLAERIGATEDVNVGFVLGDDIGFVFRVKDGEAKIDKRIPKRAPAIFRSSPADFLRILTRDLDQDEAVRSGRLTVDGDRTEVHRLFAQIPRAD